MDPPFHALNFSFESHPVHSESFRVEKSDKVNIVMCT